MRANTAIVILNYNGQKHLQQYLPGVLQWSNGCPIYVIDNCSTDQSVEILEKDFPSVKRIINDKNHGFAGGYNAGLKQIKADVFVLLNSDVEVAENWMDAPLQLLETNAQAAACQPKIKAFLKPGYFEHAGASGGFIDRYGFPFCRGRIFDQAEEDKGQYNDSKEVFWATGACMFIKADLFFKAGGFDEDFFAHMEEIDLCWRLKRLGYTIHVTPASTVYHLGGGTLNYQSPFKTRLNFRNNLYMLQKNLHNHIFVTLFWRLSLDGIAGMIFLLSGKPKHTWAVLVAHYEFYMSLGKNRRKRKAFNAAHQPHPVYPLKGWYRKSIVADYFLRKKKKFSDLNVDL